MQVAQLPVVRDVVDDDDDIIQRAIIRIMWRDRAAQPQRHALRATGLHIHLEAGAARKVRAELAQGANIVFRSRQQRAKRRAVQRVALHAKHGGDGGIGVGDAVLRIKHHNAPVGRLHDHGADLGLFAHQFFMRAVMQGDQLIGHAIPFQVFAVQAHGQAQPVPAA